jgi:hypothetical protein
MKFIADIPSVPTEAAEMPVASTVSQLKLFFLQNIYF